MMTVGMSSPADAAASGPERIRKVYEKEKAKVGGRWHTHMAAVDASGAITPSCRAPTVTTSPWPAS
jgi:beta-lactamase class A